MDIQVSEFIAREAVAQDNLTTAREWFDQLDLAGKLLARIKLGARKGHMARFSRRAHTYIPHRAIIA